MVEGSIAKHAWALTWRFIICFIVSNLMFSQLISSVQAVPESKDPMTLIVMFFFLIILLLIPYISMYGAVYWLFRRKNNVST